jgi:thioredoxin reductase
VSGTKVVIVGGGLAGLSAGCYARASGLDALDRTFTVPIEAAS